MMIQATVPTALGLFFTPWLLDHSLLIAAGVTFVAIAAMFMAFRFGIISRKQLASMALPYAAFGIALFVF